MRSLLTFECEGEALSASLDPAEGTAGVLMVTGGTQTRIGSHRMYESLAKSLAENGYPCFRYDRRGVGDSSGDNPGFRNSGPDLSAAASAFREQVPGLERLYGLGLCDGATAIALHGAPAGLDGAILINPWLVEAESGEMAPAGVRSHYRQRLLSASGWKKLATGSVDLRKLMKGLVKASQGTDSSLADEAALGLFRGAFPVALILASGDATAAAAAAEVKRAPFAGLISWTEEIDTDSHTFARPGDQQKLEAAVVDALRAMRERA